MKNVPEARKDVLRERTRRGLVGYCRAGFPAGRYLLVFLENPEEDPQDHAWAIEFSFPTPGQRGAEQFIATNEAWTELLKSFEEWKVEWAPESLNDRVFFRVYGVESPLSEEWARRLSAVDDDAPLSPVISETGTVRRSRGGQVLARTIRGAISSDPDFEIREGFRRFKKKELVSILNGTNSIINSLNNVLWDSGHTLAVVPLNASIQARPLADPWEEFSS